MNTLLHLSLQTSAVLQACVAALAMLGLGLEGMDANLDGPQKSRD
jgi:hypothetical protein